MQDLNAIAEVKNHFKKVDVLDLGNKIELHVKLLGVKKEHLDITVQHQTVSIGFMPIAGNEQMQDEPYFTVSFPHPVDRQNISASFEDNLLKVVIFKKIVQPKTESLIPLSSLRASLALVKLPKITFPSWIKHKI